MKKTLVGTGIAVALELVIAFSPYISFINFLPKNQSADLILPPVLTVIGLEFVVITLLIAFLLHRDPEKDEQRHRDVLSRIDGNNTRLIRASEFYEEFLMAATRARNRVYIAYLANAPPNDRPDPKLKKYYEEISKLPARNKDTMFIRIIRDSQPNRVWASELCEKWKGKPNANIGLLSDSSNDEMPNGLSVQIVDESCAWIVAASNHSDRGSGRDYAIEDGQINVCLATYFLRLWEKSEKLLDRGSVATEGSKNGE